MCLLQPNIVRFIDFVSGQGPSLLVMELLDFPDLEKAQKAQPLRMDQTKGLLSQLLHGLAYLHKAHITHRDLKPGNIILKSREPIHIKITDFGLAIERSEQLTSFCGTFPYLAPEAHSRHRSYSNKVDLWSVGVIALELGQGLPKYDREQYAIWPTKLHERLAATFLGPLYTSFVGSLLSWRAEDRPSAREALEHPFLPIELRPTDSPGSSMIRRSPSVLGQAQFPSNSIGSPTQYAPTPPEYRVQFHSFPSTASGQPQSSAPPGRERIANAPSPSEHAPASDADTVRASSHPGNGPAQAPAPVPPQLSMYRPQYQGSAMYWKLKYGGNTVMYRPDQRLINITQLLKVVRGKRRLDWAKLDRKIGYTRRILLHGRYTVGSYVSMEDAARILQHYNSSALTALIEEMVRQVEEWN